jgi:hypothetical protein
MYHYVYPLMPELHDDDAAIVDAETQILVTDGSCTLNLDRDMLYSHDPSLAFAVISSSITIFPLFECQATKIKANFAGRASVLVPQAC